MQYEPIKRSLGKFFSRSLFLRKSLYFLLDILLLRTWHVKKALRKIMQDLPRESLVLDAGSGFGQYTWRMSQMNLNWKFKAVDINSEQIKDCSEFFSSAGLSNRTSFTVLDLTSLNETNLYNLIISVDVMEHIENDRKVYNNFYKSLRKDGFLVISTPSDKGGSDVHSEGDESFIDEHVRDGYSIEDIEEKLFSSGFQSVETKYTYGKPGSLSWKLSMKFPIKMLNTSYLFFILLPFYYLVFFPVCLILNLFDLWLLHKSGTGLIVIARKY